MLYVMEPKVFYNVAYYEQDAINEMVVYNVGSNCNDPTIPKLELFPRYGLNIDSKEFDSQYIDQLLNDDLYFINFIFSLNGALYFRTSVTLEIFLEIPLFCSDKIRHFPG